MSAGCTHFIRRDTSTQSWAGGLGINILRKVCQPCGVEHAVLLEAPVFMV